MPTSLKQWRLVQDELINPSSALSFNELATVGRLPEVPVVPQSIALNTAPGPLPAYGSGMREDDFHRQQHSRFSGHVQYRMQDFIIA
jgi:hypothetical protein